MLVELSGGSSSTGSSNSSKKLYEHEFEKPFIAETQKYYQLESNAQITGSSCFAYLQMAKARLN
jgi:Cullin family